MFIFGLALISLFIPQLVDAKLHCYRCLNLECPSNRNKNDCEEVREFVVRQIRNYYHVGTYLPPCPELDDKVQWRTSEATEEECPRSDRIGGETCSAGRIQIKSYHPGDQPIMVSHATILGCVKENLLDAIRDSKKKTQCSIISINGTTASKYFHKIQLEHCSEIQTLCHSQDFCIHPEQSVVKPYIDNGKALARFDYGLIIGIIAFIVVIFGAIIGAGVCSVPVNKPSNLPKSNEDADLIGIRHSDSTALPLCLNRSSIEEEDKYGS